MRNQEEVAIASRLYSALNDFADGELEEILAQEHGAAATGVWGAWVLFHAGEEPGDRRVGFGRVVMRDDTCTANPALYVTLREDRTADLDSLVTDGVTSTVDEDGRVETRLEGLELGSLDLEAVVRLVEEVVRHKAENVAA